MTDIDLSMRVATVAAPVRQQVTAVVRTAILAGRFKPGDRLVERDLCELTGVSRPSVREALRELEAEGLIVNLPNRGPVVAQLERKDAESIYEVRSVLEGLAARLFAQRASDALIKQLETAVDALTEACRLGDIDAIIQKKSEFYSTLFEGAENKSIPQIVRTMNARINFLRRLSLSRAERVPETLKEINAILRAIQARDGDASFAASVYHVEQAARAALPDID